MNLTPLLLTYNLGVEKQLSVEILCMRFGIQLRAVSSEQYMEPIGALTGTEGIDILGVSYQGPSFADEMLLFSGLPDAALRGFLAAYREEGIEKINLKAAATPYNLTWNSLQLHDELKREHEELHKKK